MAKSAIRVLVVDDSVFMRAMLKDALSKTEGVEVVGSAQNGAEGLERIVALRPDVVTLDIEMPGLTGLDVLERVMKDKPLPIVVVSTKTQAGAETTLKALERGAVECVAKPLAGKKVTLESFREKVARAVLTAAHSNRSVLRGEVAIRAVSGKPECPDDAIVAIGISAGGPATLHKMFPAIPKGFPPIVITQHMPTGFTTSFANRLNDISQVEVCEATTNMALKPGLALLAPGDRHLRVVRIGNRLLAALDDGPKVGGFRPSVDVLFDSVATATRDRTVAVVMTGMGCDGSAGIRLLKKRGARTIAQDQATSVVYGMPKAAFKTGCIDRVSALADIPNAIAAALHEISESATCSA